ncbi:DUF3237 domain-containing protein [Streptomyces sp. M2CJ-2]|uniref:DUF3237 domain-containing protein n=1 Tax=Streptomyces sp. M2CJ-2 TaxID=2803948 RepID=UPI0019295A57|nr:DUF3237 domain-containing protein [Streptomyces sp. M2CJ-2]MBL3668062.1 DUF3237 domain-containing protein [Streptomyces sp. M2CJ-2]
MATEGSAMDPVSIETEFLFDYLVELKSHSRPSYAFGETPYGQRIVGGVEGGWVEGPRLKATILEGMDYGILRTDGYVAPDVRLVLRTDDGELILMTYTAGRLGPWPKVMEARSGAGVDPSEIDWILTYSFETASEKYDWLNRTLAVGRGAITEAGFRYRVDALR